MPPVSRESSGSRASPLDVRVPVSPTAFRAGGHTVLAYELHVTNITSHDVLLREIDIARDSAHGAVLQRVSGKPLAEATIAVGARDTSQEVLRIKTGRKIIVFMWVEAPGHLALPVRLFQSLIVSRTDSAGIPPDTIGPVVTAVSSRRATTIAAPLEGGFWLARNGPDNGADHRRTLIAVNGVSRIAQRFATDWIMLGPNNRMWQGDSTTNRAWYGYGQPVHAVSKGVIVSTQDRIAENSPLSEARAVPITLETAAGNFVIERLSTGEFALYAHLQPGSLRVKPGQSVRSGEVVGLVGNSGNSGAPHLHFHLMDSGESALGGEGLPFELQEFSDAGTPASLDDFFAPKPWAPAFVKPRRSELPTENMVVRFPVRTATAPSN